MQAGRHPVVIFSSSAMFSKRSRDSNHRRHLRHCHPFEEISKILKRGNTPTDTQFMKAVVDRRKPPSYLFPHGSSWDNDILDLYYKCKRVDPNFSRTISEATFHRIILRSRSICRKQQSPARALLWHREMSDGRDASRDISLEEAKIYNTLIDICAKTNNFAMAETLYKEISDSELVDLHHITSLVNAKSRARHPLNSILQSTAEHDSNSSQCNEQADSTASFVRNGGAQASVLIDTMGFSNAPKDRIHAAFQSIPEELRTRNHYLSVIEAHSRCGYIDDALKFVREMKRAKYPRRGGNKPSAYRIIMSLSPRTCEIDAKIKRVAEDLKDTWWLSSA